MISVTLDGQTIEVPAGTTVLQAAKLAGIEIPTLCDHPSLKPYGGCRLCVVEVKGFRTLQASCTLPAFDGMVVNTDSSKVKKAREFVLDLIFSERNHFCMYCQKTNGDCELQNAAYGEDMTHWSIQPAWKPFLVDASHPYFVFDHNRCILCRRCVRACSDLVGNHTLNVENRGARSLVVADTGVPMGESSCIRCGSCLQICPTGALMDRHSAYMGTVNDITRVERVCSNCSVGCSTEVHVRDNQVVRIQGIWDAPLNNGLLCEVGRFQSVEEDRERLTTPMVRKNGVLEPATWEEAIGTLGARLDGLRRQNGAGIAALASTRLPVEALYAFTELFKSLGAGSLTSIEEDRTASLPANPALDGDLEALKKADLVIAIGADLYKKHQVAGFMVRRNLAQGTRMIVIDTQENQMASGASAVLQPRSGTDAALLKGLMSALIDLGAAQTDAPGGFEAGNYTLSATSQVTGVSMENLAAAARLMASAEHPIIVYGKGITQGGYSEVMQSVADLAQVSGAKLLCPRGKSNSLAAQTLGLTGRFQGNGQQAVFLALGDDDTNPQLMQEIEHAPFLAVQASYRSEATDRADVILPVEMWAESEGHYINMEGRVQEARRAITAPAGVLSSLASLQQLADCLGFALDSQWNEKFVRREPVAA
jgi:formate dehydrogenase major subunit